MGSLAIEPATDGRQLSGVLVKRNFNYHLIAPTDLNKYTDLVMSTISQKLSVHFSGNLEDLARALTDFECKEVETTNGKELVAFRSIHINLNTKDKYATLEWVSSPISDMYADSIVADLWT